MGYDPDDMFRLANHMFTSSLPSVQQETFCRAVIGRVYYACYLTARDRLWGVDGRPTSTQEHRLPRGHGGRRLGLHERDIEALGVNPSVPSHAKRKHQKDFLSALKALRTAADYRHSDTHPDVQKLFNQYRVTTWDKLAEQALVLGSQLLPELATHPRFP